MELAPRDWRSLSPEDLAAQVGPRILERAREYLRRGQVAAGLIDGNRLAASVLGTSGWYVINIVLDDGRLEPSCTCPYQGAFCKHAAALILWWLAAPDSFLDLDKSLPAKTHQELLHLCRELAVAAPARATALLTHDITDGSSAAAAAALAKNLVLAVDHGRGGQEDLAERLEWIAARLSAAMASGSREAAGAAMDLLESLLSTWGAEPGEGPPVQVISEYLGRLADAWPADLAGDLAIIARLVPLFCPETGAFHGELGILAMKAGLRDGAGGALSQAGREILALLEERRSSVKVVSFSSLLALLEAYERLERRREAAALARDGLRRPDESERYVLRQRLARYHQEVEEPRQALAYLAANFLARPDVEGWSQMRRLAVITGEWDRLKPGVYPAALNGPEPLRIKSALDETDQEALAALARAVDDLHPQALQLRLALAEFLPEEALDLLIAGSRACLECGGHKARRQSAAYIRAVGKICRRQGWQDRWLEFRAILRREYQAALNWPELGSLLAEEGDGGGE